MPFIYEKVPEADREKYNALGFKDALHHPMVADKYARWAIDRERDAILVGLGGRGGWYDDIPSFYSLVWRGKWIGFELFTKGRGNGEIGIETWFRFSAINIPGELGEQKDQVLELIREGLHAKDSLNGSIKVIAHHFEFIQPYFY